MFKTSMISANAIAFMVICLASSASAQDFTYFGNGIDFWGESKASMPKQPVSPAQPSAASPSSTEAKPDSSAFPWGKYLDPKNKEFFKEGDYTPPEPFMEIVRNPSDSNLKLWFSYMEKRNELSERLQQRMREYAEKRGVGVQVPQMNEAIQRASVSKPSAPVDPKRYRFRMYFESTCPHCHRMFGTLRDLQAQGFLVEAKQVDPAPLAQEGVSIPIERASPDELRSKSIQSVPVLFIGDLTTKQVYRLNGYQSVASIFQSLRQEVP